MRSVGRPTWKPMPRAKKSNVGRPSLGAAARHRSVLVRLTEAEHGVWRSLADQQGITVSELVRESVEMAVARGASR